VQILVVDDHPLIRQAMREVLRRLDAAVEMIEAETAAKALDLADRHPQLDLVLLDLALPDRDGLETLVALRERHPSLPVVVLSAHADEATVTRALDAGAMGFIPRTARSEALLDALECVLSGGVYLPTEVLAGRDARAGAAGPRSSPPGAPGAAFDLASLGLTGRQTDVLALIVQGKPNKVICRDLGLAEATVKVHVTAILRALGVENRTQAVIEAARRGLRLTGIVRSAP